MMTLGKLMDMITDLKREEAELAMARQALLHGGSPETMQRKREMVSYHEREVERKRDHVLEL